MCIDGMRLNMSLMREACCTNRACAKLLISGCMRLTWLDLFQRVFEHMYQMHEETTIEGSDLSILTLESPLNMLGLFSGFRLTCCCTNISRALHVMKL